MNTMYEWDAGVHMLTYSRRNVLNIRKIFLPEYRNMPKIQLKSTGKNI